MATRSSILIPLALFVLLFAATHAPAAVVEVPPIDPAILALEDEEPEAEAAADEVEEEFEEECEELEEGFEECEEVEAEAARSRGEACLLRSTRAHASLDRSGKKLKLTIGYTTYEPVDAKIEIGKGARRIASTRRHLSRSGVLRIVKSLGKIVAPKRIVVRLAIPATPSYCGKHQVQKVKVR